MAMSKIIAESGRRMQIGEGRISGAFSIAFGAISLGGVLCFLFPNLLTTPEFRAQYDIAVLRHILSACLFTAFGFALRSLIANPSKRAALVGGSLAILALALGGAGVEGGELDGSSVYISLDWLLLDLIAMALVFVPLELFFPKRLDQTKFHPEWRTDLAYFVMGHLFVQAVAISTQEPVKLLFAGANLEGLRTLIAGLPYLVQVLIAVLVADIFQYAIHRAFHKIPYLWRFHSVHHSTRSMDWLAGSRQHFVDVFFTRMLVYLPLFALGFDEAVLYTYVAIVAVHAVLNHTNTRLPYGPLELFIVSPRIHCWHHSTSRSSHNKNFAVHFPWIDRLLGTYHAPGSEWPKSVGLYGVSFPKGFVRQHLYPFTHNPESDMPADKTSKR
jgi:sterol desaturase/sphingolipid hydroxylase (fatty acid hydroxylase superfamily)